MSTTCIQYVLKKYCEKFLFYPAYMQKYICNYYTFYIFNGNEVFTIDQDMAINES